jgi:hypothetical protein
MAVLLSTVFPDTCDILSSIRFSFINVTVYKEVLDIFSFSSRTSHVNHTEYNVHKHTYEGVSKSFRTGRLERELQMVQLSATNCSFVDILWVSLVSFASITFVLLLNE